MKTRNREINIFSMSALDLFASALGAFILIAIILLPFFPNLNANIDSEKLKRENEKLKAENEQLEKRVEAMRRSSQSPNSENEKLKRENAKLQREIDNTAVLLGIETKAQKLVLVVDMSGSIYQAGRQDYRQFIKLSVQAMLDAFRSKIELCMIGFHAPNRVT